MHKTTSPPAKADRTVAFTALLALAAAIGAALAPTAGATTSQPMLILANGNESLLWHTVGAGSTTLYPKKSSWSLIRAAQPCGSGSE